MTMRGMEDTVRDTLERYVGGQLKPSGNNLLANCPFHDWSPGQHRFTLSVSVVHGQWTCFSCGEGGGFPYLLKKLQVPGTVRDDILDPVKFLLQRPTKPSLPLHRDPFAAEHTLPEAVLGVYEFCPIELVDDGFDEALLQDYDVGYDYSQDRVTWPVRDLYGSLTGIMGRGPDGSYPKYKGYKRHDYDEETQTRIHGYEFQRSLFLWNMDRVHPRLYPQRNPSAVVLCEGFKAALWCVQHGFPNTVAIMGARLSFTQAELLRRLGADIIIFLDEDDAGVKGSVSAYDMLRRACRVSFGMYPADARQPDDLDPDELHDTLNNPATLQQWLDIDFHKETWEEWRTRRYELSQKRRRRATPHQPR